MNILILGAGGFICTNLTLKLAEEKSNIITLVDKSKGYFIFDETECPENVSMVESDFTHDTDFDKLLVNQDIVYHIYYPLLPLWNGY